MVHLKTLQCSICEEQCAPDFTDNQRVGKIGLFRGNSIFTFFKIVCGTCVKKAPKDGLDPKYNCDATCDEMLNAIDYLANVAPEDELKLLDFGKWNPKFCRNCDTPTPFIGVYNSECDRCKTPATREGAYFCNIAKELSEYFKPIPYKPVKRWRRVLAVSAFFACSECGSLATRFTDEGKLYCDCVPDGKYALEPKMMWNLSQLLHCVPDADDLRSLTYSKWTPFRCSVCSIPYTNEQAETPFYHPECGSLQCRDCFELAGEGCCASHAVKVIRASFILTAAQEFRKYFKVEKECSSTTEIVEPNQNARKIFIRKTRREAKQSSTKEILPNDAPNFEQQFFEKTDFEVNGSGRQRIPRTLRCACDREDDVEHFFECDQCSEMGFCPVCLYQKHWKHDVNKLKPRMVQVIMAEESERTLKKFGEWMALTKTMDEQGGNAFAEVVDLLQEIYKKAVSTSDLTFVATALAEADISCLEGDMQRMVIVKKQFAIQLTDFRDKLSSLIGEDQESGNKEPNLDSQLE